jgi:hypothetical protein
MKTIIIAVAVVGLAAGMARAQFLPNHLAVLRAGDGEIKLHLKQSPVFIDEFAPGSFNPGPVTSVAIPTNGPDAIFFNGHAATEGMLSRSADGKLLVFAGYAGVNLLQQSGTPSQLDIGRGLGMVDAAGKTQTIIAEEYNGTAKMNPRGATADGAGHFWTCGNAFGTAYYDAGASNLVKFTAIPDSRQVKIINGALYATLNGPDAIFVNTEPGIFSFADDGDAAALPQAANTTLKLEVPVEKSYGKIAGFDLNKQGTIAYTADVNQGIQKYVKGDNGWKFAYNFSIPQNIVPSANNAAGCFGVAVDFSGKAPIIYATTTEGYNGAVNSNRVVQIVDMGANSPVTTIAQANSVNIAYRGIDFTPQQ